MACAHPWFGERKPMNIFAWKPDMRGSRTKPVSGRRLVSRLVLLTVGVVVLWVLLDRRATSAVQSTSAVDSPPWATYLLDSSAEPLRGRTAQPVFIVAGDESALSACAREAAANTPDQSVLDDALFSQAIGHALSLGANAPPTADGTNKGGALAVRSLRGRVVSDASVLLPGAADPNTAVRAVRHIVLLDSEGGLCSLVLADCLGAAADLLDCNVSVRAMLWRQHAWRARGTGAADDGVRRVPLYIATAAPVVAGALPWIWMDMLLVCAAVLTPVAVILLWAWWRDRSARRWQNLSR